MEEKKISLKELAVISKKTRSGQVRPLIVKDSASSKKYDTINLTRERTKKVLHY